VLDMRGFAISVRVGGGLIAAFLSAVGFFGLDDDWFEAGGWLEGLSEPQLRVALVVLALFIVAMAFPWSLLIRRRESSNGPAATQTLGQGAVGVQQQGSPGATITVKVFQYLSEERSGAAPAVVRPSQRYRYPNDWERLRDLPDKHLETLAGILQAEKGKLRHLDAETEYLIDEGWAEIRQQPYRNAAVVGVPDRMLPLVEEYFSEMGTLHIEAMVNKALASAEGKAFLQVFTDEAGRLSFAAYQEGIHLTWRDLSGASLVSEHQEGDSCTFSIPDATFEALGGKIGGKDILRRSVTIQNDSIEDFHSRLHTIPPSAGRWRLARRP